MNGKEGGTQFVTYERFITTVGHVIVPARVPTRGRHGMLSTPTGPILSKQTLCLILRVYWPRSMTFTAASSPMYVSLFCFLFVFFFFILSFSPPYYLLCWSAVCDGSPVRGAAAALRRSRVRPRRRGLELGEQARRSLLRARFDRMNKRKFVNVIVGFSFAPAFSLLLSFLSLSFYIIVICLWLHSSVIKFARPYVHMGYEYALKGFKV